MTRARLHSADREMASLLTKGKALFAEGKYGHAATLFLTAADSCPCGVTVRTRGCVCKDLKLGVASNTLKEVLMKPCTCPARSSRRCDNPAHLDSFDSLAAAYERDGQLDLSVRCAEQMIHLCPREPKGYLRLGKLLRLQGRAPLALLTYTQGIHLVGRKHSQHHFFAKMVEQRDKLRPLLIKIDPVTQFPLEIVDMIFENVDFRTLCRSICVSKTWRAYLTKARFLWQIQEYNYGSSLPRQAKDWVTLKSLAMYASFAAHKITELSIDNCSRFNLTPAKFTKMISLAPRLEVLKLRTALPGNPILLEDLPASVTIPKLRSLYLGNKMRFTPRTIEQLLTASADSLEEFSMFNFADVATLRTPPPPSWQHIDWPHMPRLKVFRLGCGGHKTIVDLHSIMHRTPYVEDVWLDDVVLNHNFEKESVPWQKLKTIFVGGRAIFPLVPVSRLPRLNEDMREVYLEGSAFDRFCGYHVPAGNASLVPASGVMVPHLAQVEKLSVSTRDEMDKERFEAILRPSITSGSLRELDIRPWPFSKVDFASEELDWFRSEHITFISLTGFTALGMHLDISLDQFLIKFVARFPNLRCLEIDQEVIGDSTLAAFVKMGVRTIYHMWAWEKELINQWAATAYGAEIIYGRYLPTPARHPDRA
ncbi:hypothetical protein F4779DRAFT_554567 [Xylariaceae sp. FL0662B]|nr:hypothetical protein F4779DRAFT_554567 [Xylariaceae sp. FL0662B]